MTTIDWGLIRLWMRSPAPLVMLQVQDVLGLGIRGADEPAGDRRRRLEVRACARAS